MTAPTPPGGRPSASDTLPVRPGRYSPLLGPDDEQLDGLVDSLEDAVATDLEEATRVEVPLGRRVMVVGDLLLAPEPTPSSLALASDLAGTLHRWQGPGTVIVCGNLFANPCGEEAGLRRAGPDVVARPSRPGRRRPHLHQPPRVPTSRPPGLA